MIIVRTTVASLVFLLVLILSFVLSSRYLDDKFYYETLNRLLKHEEKMDNALIVDLQRMRNIVVSSETSSYNDESNICEL